MFPFFIKKQRDALERYAEEVATLKGSKQNASVTGVKASLDNASHAYSLYIVGTRSIFGKVKSLIPGTTAFNYRIKAAKNISNAFEMIKQQEQKLRELKTTSAKSNPYATLTRTQRALSDNRDSTLPTHHENPIRRTKSADNTLACSPVKTPVNLTKTTRPVIH